MFGPSPYAAFFWQGMFLQISHLITLWMLPFTWFFFSLWCLYNSLFIYNCYHFVYDMSCVNLFMFIMFETVYVSCTCISVSFFSFGNFSAIIISNIFLIPVSLSLSSFWNPFNANVGIFSFFFFQKSLKLLSFCKSVFFFLLFWLGDFYYFIFQITYSFFWIA